MTLTTERLQIRPFQAEDIEWVYEYYKDKQLNQYLLDEPWTEQTRHSEFAKKLAKQNLSEDAAVNLACVLNGIVIGDVAVWKKSMRNTVEIGYVFNPDYSHKGYAREAVAAIVRVLFAEYGIHRIEACMDARNLSSSKLCEAIGMRREAHFIKDFWNKGEWTDSYIYGMLAEDLK